MAKIYTRGRKKKPKLILSEVSDSVVTFTIKNNDFNSELIVTNISLTHKKKVDKYIETLVCSRCPSYEHKVPRENLGNYILDLDNNLTRLTKSTDVIRIKPGGHGNFFFNFKIDTSRVDSRNKVFDPLDRLSWRSSLYSLLKTDWLESFLVVYYIGRNRSYILRADMKQGYITSESIDDPYSLLDDDVDLKEYFTPILKR